MVASRKNMSKGPHVARGPHFPTPGLEITLEGVSAFMLYVKWSDSLVIWRPVAR